MKKFEEIIVTKEDGEVVAVISGNEIIELEGYRVDLRGKGGKEKYKPMPKEIIEKATEIMEWLQAEKNPYVKMEITYEGITLLSTDEFIYISCSEDDEEEAEEETP